jgi:type I restriction enzyme M protein
MSFEEFKQLIWNIADTYLRSKFKAHDYGDIILPFIVLRRLDCTLEQTKERVLTIYDQRKNEIKNKDALNNY